LYSDAGNTVYMEVGSAFLLFNGMIPKNLVLEVLYLYLCVFLSCYLNFSLFNTVSRYRGRRSRTRSPSVSRSPRYRNRHYSRSGSPVRSRSPVDVSKSRLSPRVSRQRSPSSSRSPSKSRSSLDSQSPKRASKDRSRSSSRSPGEKKGLVSYDDGSPDSSQR